jgi:pimeloyl-ACP methyl ester carboxylesterase
MSRIIVGGIGVLLVLLIGLTWLLGSRAKARLAAKYPPPGQIVDVGGYRLHINCQGSPMPGSPTVVMEGGNAESCLTWAAVQPEVARFARVCTYDRAGLGWSERSPKPRTASNITEELHTLLAKAGVEPPYVLVGHSIGGMFVRYYAHRYPDQVAGMVLVDAAHEEQYLRFPESMRRLQQQSLTMMVWVMRLLKMLNSIGLLALLPDQAGSAWSTPIPKQVREAYLGIVFSGTKSFEACLLPTSFRATIYGSSVRW